MAKIFCRTWTSKGPLGKRVRHTGYGYTLTVNGKRERKMSSAWLSEHDAMAALSARLDQVKHGRLETQGDVSLGRLAVEYVTYKTEQGKRSIQEDERIIKRYLLPTFDAALQIRRLSPAMIASYERRRTGEVSAWTVRNELTILRHMLRLAKRWGYLEQVPDIEMPKTPRGRMRFLSVDEIAALLQACLRSKNPFLTHLVILALHTGMRKAELLGLRWERVDLDKDLGFNARITLYDTKNGEPRGVPLNTDAITALRTIEPDPAKRVGWVFKRRNGQAWGQIRTAFETALDRAAIPDFRFHDLRHTCASHMAMRGRRLNEIQEILGHKSLSMTKRYAHLSPSHLHTTVASLEGLTPIPPLDEMTHEMAQNRKPVCEVDEFSSQSIDIPTPRP